MRMKMEKLGIRSQSAYLRKMALDGYSVKLDLQDVKEMVSLLRRCSNNLNQYAKRANETGSIYEADIKDLQARFDEILGENCINSKNKESSVILDMFNHKKIDHKK